jgi:carbon-monoxide dehydrogenase medium subunit
MRATGAESLLEGSAISGNLIGEAAAAAARESKPLTDLRASAEYRRDMIVVLVGRALEQAFARAGGAS